MSINLSTTANNFKLVAQSFENENHSYIAIEKDGNNRISGCKVTSDRENRSSLSEINELVQICLQENDNTDDETLADLQLIDTGLSAVRAKIIEHEHGCCSGLWFWLMCGDSIVDKTMELLTTMSHLSKRIISTDFSLEEGLTSNFRPTPLRFNDEEQQMEVESHREALSKIDAKTLVKLERSSNIQFQTVSFYTGRLLTKENGFELIANDRHDVACKNRYTNILPYKNNYYGKESFEGYVNASHISVNGVNYIATQGPLFNTIEHFIKMVVSSGGTIVTLANEYERNSPKCFNYWHLENPISVDGWDLTLLEDQELYSENNQIVQKRTFSLSKEQEPLKIFTQFHLVNWPDLGIPDENVFDKFLEAVEEYHPDTNPNPIVVHCSAGIGRTGTFIATHSNRHKIRLQRAQNIDKDNIFVNLAEDVLIMRSQRMGQVQTNAQFFAVQKAIYRYQKTL